MFEILKKIWRAAAPTPYATKKRTYVPTTQDGAAHADNPISRVAEHLRVMGYDLTRYGAGVALLQFESGYNEVETASHIAHTTLAFDVREAGDDIDKLLGFVRRTAWRSSKCSRTTKTGE
jgi:hypothetical protein